MHSILKRQLRRYLHITDEQAVPDELQEFVHAVSEAYIHFDEDRELLERSINISSTELQQINEQLKLEIEALRDSQAENKELEQMNKFMIGRELRMAELKKQLATLTKQYEDLQSKQSAQ